jgi:hypothetical protein
MKRPWDAIVWWELRRIPYNTALVIVGVGTISLSFMTGSHLGAVGENALNPLGLIIGVALYGLAANLFYTLGWMSELFWSGGDTDRTEPFRKRVFWAGLIFSCAVTLLPAVPILILWSISGVLRTS